MQDQIRGLICPMVTPFDKAGKVDHGAVRVVVDFLLARGVQVLFPCGSTGEGPLLSVEERKKVAETVVEHSAGRVPVIVHTGTMRTDESIALTQHARDIKAAAASIITPYFFTYTEEALYEHYLAIARAVEDFPLFIYTFPGNGKHDVSPELLQRLRRAAGNIVGIKSSNPQLMRLQEYIAVGGSDFIPLCGVDGLMLPGLAIGSLGQVSGNSNVWPEIFCALFDAFEAGDLATAQSCQAQIDRLRTVLYDGLHPAAFKAGLALRGVPAGCVRAPMRELSAEAHAQLARELHALGVV